LTKNRFRTSICNDLAWLSDEHRSGHSALDKLRGLAA